MEEGSPQKSNLVIEIGVAHFLTGHVCEDLSDDDISVGKVVFEGYQLEPVEQALDDVGRVQRLLLLVRSCDAGRSCF